MPDNRPNSKNKLRKLKKLLASKNVLSVAAVFGAPPSSRFPLFFTHGGSLRSGLDFRKPPIFRNVFQQSEVKSDSGAATIWAVGKESKVSRPSSSKKEEFSDKDMPKLAPLLIEAESFGGLYFCRTDLTDRSLQHFPAGVNLETLDFRTTGVTKDGIGQLLLRLPHLQETTIIFDEGAVRHNQWRQLDDLR